jgi:hypothetical protein
MGKNHSFFLKKGILVKTNSQIDLHIINGAPPMKLNQGLTVDYQKKYNG